MLKTFASSILGQPSRDIAQKIASMEDDASHAVSSGKPSSADIPRNFSVPSVFNHFANMLNTYSEPDRFQGRDSVVSGKDTKSEFQQVRGMAKHILHEGGDLAPNQQAIERTERAAQTFFQLAYGLISPQTPYPLKNKNKCVGFLAIPQSKLVLIAISEDRDPSKDIDMRKSMCHFISQINQLSKAYVFELVVTPTREQYLLLRTLSFFTSKEAPDTSSREAMVSKKVAIDLIEPRTRCAEVALAVAACKIGRSKTLKLSELGMVQFGSGLWEMLDKKDIKVLGFEAAKRNTQYIKRPPLIFSVGDDKHKEVALDRWDPCENHCALFLNELRALAAAGSSATTFSEPRSESIFRKFS